MPSNEFLRERLPLDELGSRKSIDIVHSKIHDGLHFTTSYYEKITAGGSAINILITAPSSGTAIYHFVAEFGTDGPGIFTLSKTPNATTSDSTAIVAYNNNETSANTSSLVHTVGGTYTSSGTILSTYVIGGSSGIGANKIIVGGAGDSRYEWELGSESKHLLRWVADLASCRTSIRTHFYRE